MNFYGFVPVILFTFLFFYLPFSIGGETIGNFDIFPTVVYTSDVSSTHNFSQVFPMMLVSGDQLDLAAWRKQTILIQLMRDTK